MSASTNQHHTLEDLLQLKHRCQLVLRTHVIFHVTLVRMHQRTVKLNYSIVKIIFIQKDVQVIRFLL